MLDSCSYILYTRMVVIVVCLLLVLCLISLNLILVALYSATCNGLSADCVGLNNV